MDFKKMILDRAKKNAGSVIFPEIQNDSVVFAALSLLSKKIATKVYLVGDPKIVKDTFSRLHIAPHPDIIHIDPKNHKNEEYASIFYEMRKAKGLTLEEAKKQMENDIFHAAMMLREGVADVMVSGSMSPTADTVRAAIKVVGMKEGSKLISGIMFLDTPAKELGEDGVFVYSDIGVVEDPSAEQLAEIAIMSAKTTRSILGIEPVVALLSFSTKGSAKAKSVDKVQEAVKILESKNVDFAFDGEFQLDAAIIEKVGKKKAPDSKIAGHANVLIFPNLDAGNIAYKITQRIGKADAFGPMLQGPAKPINDLSRGANVNDIVYITALSLLQRL